MKKLCKCKREKLVEALREFHDRTQGDCLTITENDVDGNPVPGTTRKATCKDRLDFVLDSWADTAMALEELGIDLDGDES